MIPLQLELANFLSYRERMCVDMEGIHLACISGSNGAGKSTLLDAMTWALFGKSRSRSEDDLVNRIAARKDETAEVRLTFDLEGTVYRIIRQKRSGRTGVLEFQIQVGDDQWRTMSEGGLRETQAAVEQTLRMGYDTFINASFFLQGQADEFTTRTAGKRKEILAELLGVDRWDAYKAAAAERRKAEEEKRFYLEGRLNEIESELGEEQARKDAVAAAREQLARVGARLNTQEQLMQQMERVETALQQQTRQVENLLAGQRQAEARLANMERTRQKRREERESYEALLEKEAEIAAAFAAWQQAEQALAGWQEKAEAFSRLAQQRRPHELAVARARTRLEERRAELTKQRARLDEMAREQQEKQMKLADAEEEIAAAAAKLATLAEQEVAWRAARESLQELRKVRALWQQEAAQLEKQEQAAQKLAREQKDVAQNLEQAKVALQQLAEERNTYTENRERLIAAQAERDNLRSRQDALRASMKKLKERELGLEAETGSTCPLCGQELSEAHRDEVLADIRQEGEQEGELYRARGARLQELVAEIEKLETAVKDGARLQREEQAQQQRRATAEARLEETERAVAEWEEAGAARLEALRKLLADEAALKEQEAEVARLETVLQEKESVEATRRALQQETAGISARLTEIARAQAEWAEQGAPELKKVSAQMQDEAFAPEAQVALAALEVEAAGIGYDEAGHTAARSARAELEAAPGRYQELQRARAAVKPLEDTLADLDAQIAEQEAEFARLAVQHEQATEQLETLRADGGDLGAVVKEVMALREAKSAAERQLGAAQQRLKVLDDLRRQHEQLVEEMEALGQLVRRLRMLEEACGHKGVQALLIEQALPEIEEDANELLDRLSGGEMRVLFDTQRARRSGEGMIETLDIHISDAAGERPYENYSGGEQFRVNFAIRLALSRILAKRAGARLRTLVIDEGFGSQDPNGRQRLVEAINMIKDDFARILVITHIDELKDAFPTRIEVEKGAQGSRVTVV